MSLISNILVYFLSWLSRWAFICFYSSEIRLPIHQNKCKLIDINMIKVNLSIVTDDETSTSKKKCQPFMNSLDFFSFGLFWVSCQTYIYINWRHTSIGNTFLSRLFYSSHSFVNLIVDLFMNSFLSLLKILRRLNFVQQSNIFKI